jgi:predicted nucleotidyltransferase
VKTVSEFASENGLSAERVRQLCKQGILSDVKKIDSGRYGTWLIGDACVLPATTLGRPRKTRLGARVGQIKKVVAQLLPPGSHAWIFGSILDVTKRGGDVDVYVEVETPDLRTRGKLRHEISKIADGKKVDIVMVAFNDERAKNIRSVATKGLVLL